MSKLLPFDLEAAKSGAKVVTRDGRPARIVCFDAKDRYPIIALVDNKDGTEICCSFTADGHHLYQEPESTTLMMLPTPVKRWRVVYRGDDDNAAQRDFEERDDACAFAKECDIGRIEVLATTPFLVEVTP